LRTACLATPLTFTVTQVRASGKVRGVHQLMDEERAYTLAARVARTPSYGVLEVRRAWSAMYAWQVEAKDRRTGERLLLLSEDQFDNRRAADRPTTAQPITVQTIKHAAVSSN